MKYALAETRRILRDRFARYLPLTQSAPSAPKSGNLLPDEQLLELLLGLNILCESDIDRSRATYDAALPPGGGEPSLDEVIAAGWMRVVWGRVTAPFEIDHRARSQPDGKLSALAALLKKRFEQKYTVGEAARANAELESLAAAIERGEAAPDALRSQSPEWVAARLWDRALSGSASHGAALRVWVDRWRLLGWPSLVAHEVWNEAAADAFREAAIAVLASEPGLTGWDETRGGFIRQISLRTGQPPENAERHVPALSATLLDRARWLNDVRLEGAIAGMMSADQDIVSVIRLLLADVEKQEFSPAPHPLFKQLIELAVARPEILVVILFRIRWSPALLADLLLYPATSAIACWLVSEWSGPSGAWDRELRARDDKTTKAMAFADAASVLGDFLEQGSLPPAEAASLLGVLYRTAKPAFGDEAADDGSIVGILRDEIAGQSAEVQQAIYAGLSTRVSRSGLGSAEFAAALDIVDAADLVESVDPAPLVSAYVSSVAAGGYGLSANRIGESAAAALVKLAMKAPEALRSSFFAPVDVGAKIAAAKAPDVNPLTIEDETARSLRAHIRILCRAVAGLEESGAEELTEALTKTVRVGALKHDEKGRVGAFAARFETEPYRGQRDRPIAADVAAALSALAGKEREELLTAILDIDEPIVLAQLVGLAPQEARARIESRLDALTPSDAAAIRSLPEAKARIEALLTAGRVDAAAKFIEDERGLKTLGKVAGRELTQFRDDLHLKWLRKDWSGIWGAEPPPEFSGQTRDVALDYINFFKGLAALSDPGVNPEGAENFFGDLHRRHPHVPTYAVNLFAAQISHLLGADAFAELEGSALNRGRQLLAEAEQAIVRLRDVSAADLETFNCNKALLLLALGEPNRAYGVLESVPPGRLRDSAAAYSAVALNRMGRTREALAVLDQSVRAIGETSLLRAVREYIRSGKQFAAFVSLATGDDRIPRMKEALCNLWEMDPQEQTAALTDHPEPFVSYVLDQVRAAAESVISALAAMKAEKPKFHEDDLTGLMRMPLAAGVRFLRWTVAEQPPGGYSPRGNPGKRDLAIQCNGWTLAVIEALLCRDPVTYQSVEDNLTSHFQRLLGYFPGALFFHLTYSYVDEPSSVLRHLKLAAASEAPPGFTYKGIAKDIELTDSRPTGFIAEYEGPMGRLKVVFLVLDMRQFAQREAAKAAGNH
jgi:hypothetical protein